MLELLAQPVLIGCQGLGSSPRPLLLEPLALPRIAYAINEGGDLVQHLGIDGLNRHGGTAFLPVVTGTAAVPTLRVCPRFGRRRRHAQHRTPTVRTFEKARQQIPAAGGTVRQWRPPRSERLLGCLKGLLIDKLWPVTLPAVLKPTSVDRRFEHQEHTSAVHRSSTAVFVGQIGNPAVHAAGAGTLGELPEGFDDVLGLNRFDIKHAARRAARLLLKRSGSPAIAIWHQPGRPPSITLNLLVSRADALARGFDFHMRHHREHVRRELGRLAAFRHAMQLDAEIFQFFPRARALDESAAESIQAPHDNHYLLAGMHQTADFTQQGLIARPIVTP